MSVDFDFFTGLVVRLASRVTVYTGREVFDHTFILEAMLRGNARNVGALNKSCLQVQQVWTSESWILDPSALDLLLGLPFPLFVDLVAYFRATVWPVGQSIPDSRVRNS